MPVWLEITLGALLAVFVLLTLGGMLANARAQARDRERLEADLDAANRAQAAAHAQDRGWERSTLEAAARAAYDGAHPEAPASELALVQVIDRPGTDDDKAVFRVVSAVGETRLTLGREAGEWRAE